MGFFTKVAQFLGSSTQSAESKRRYPSENYKGFTITPQPIADHGQFRIAALIEKAEDQEQGSRRHHFIRSDTAVNADLAAELTLTKCKVFIDQMGDNIFD